LGLRKLTALRLTRHKNPFRNDIRTYFSENR
jgi:hypothetical protein